MQLIVVLIQLHIVSCIGSCCDENNDDNKLSPDLSCGFTSLAAVLTNPNLAMSEDSTKKHGGMTLLEKSRVAIVCLFYFHHLFLYCCLAVQSDEIKV